MNDLSRMPPCTAGGVADVRVFPDLFHCQIIDSYRALFSHNLEIKCKVNIANLRLSFVYIYI